MAQKVKRRFIREQQISLYILHIFLYLTITSIPFYFHRTVEAIFEGLIVFEEIYWFNSCTFPQLLLFGVSFQPIVYVILLVPPETLFKLKCFTSIRIEHIYSRHNFRLMSIDPKLDVEDDNQNQINEI